MSKARLVNFTKASAEEKNKSNLMRRINLLETKTYSLVYRIGYEIDKKTLNKAILITLASNKPNNRYKKSKAYCKQLISAVKYTERAGHVVNKH